MAATFENFFETSTWTKNHEIKLGQKITYDYMKSILKTEKMFFVNYKGQQNYDPLNIYSTIDNDTITDIINIFKGSNKLISKDNIIAFNGITIFCIQYVCDDNLSEKEILDIINTMNLETNNIALETDNIAVNENVEYKYKMSLDQIDNLYNTFKYEINNKYDDFKNTVENEDLLKLGKDVYDDILQLTEQQYEEVLEILKNAYNYGNPENIDKYMEILIDTVDNFHKYLNDYKHRLLDDLKNYTEEYIKELEMNSINTNSETEHNYKTTLDQINNLYDNFKNELNDKYDDFKNTVKNEDILKLGKDVYEDLYKITEQQYHEILDILESTYNNGNPENVDVYVELLKATINDFHRYLENYKEDLIDHLNKYIKEYVNELEVNSIETDEVDVIYDKFKVDINVIYDNFKSSVTNKKILKCGKCEFDKILELAKEQYIKTFNCNSTNKFKYILKCYIDDLKNNLNKQIYSSKNLIDYISNETVDCFVDEIKKCSDSCDDIDDYTSDLKNKDNSSDMIVNVISNFIKFLSSMIIQNDAVLSFLTYLKTMKLFYENYLDTYVTKCLNWIDNFEITSVTDDKKCDGDINN